VQYDTLRQPEQRSRSDASVEQCAHRLWGEFDAILLLAIWNKESFSQRIFGIAIKIYCRSMDGAGG
jgi:hypothetical protein